MKAKVYLTNGMKIILDDYDTVVKALKVASSEAKGTDGTKIPVIELPGELVIAAKHITHIEAYE